jgi:hypothetical protein
LIDKMKEGKNVELDKMTHRQRLAYEQKRSETAIQAAEPMQRVRNQQAVLLEPVAEPRARP